MTNTREVKDYLFDTGSDLGGEHMAHLQSVFDPVTFGVLDAVDVQPGQRCLDLGAGGGSVTQWLAGLVGSAGQVLAVDIDTTHLADGRGVQVHRHDINDGLTGPLAGPYDLIHARLTLLHLPRRNEIFAELAASLAPGGWIVIGDISSRPLTVLSDTSEEDIAVWKRIQHLSHEVVSPAAGIDWGWAHRINDRMVAEGLMHVDGIEWSTMVSGGSAGALLHANLNTQARAPLLAAGAEPWELQRYQDLTRDPTFRTWFYQFVCVRGQRPR